MNRLIEQTLKQPEGKQLEFKRDLSSPKPIMKTLTAFANTAGGTLIIGITDSGEVIGTENPLDEEERLCSLIADSIAPKLVPNIELVTVEDKTLLVVEVYSSGSRPHWLRSHDAQTGVFVRLGSTNRQADHELIAELQRSVSGLSFDEMPMPELTIDDLDIDAAQKIFPDHKQLNEQALDTLRLITEHQGKLVPTKGAILLFGKQRDKYFPDAWIQCGRFIGTDKTNIFDHIDIYDHLPAAVNSIMLFLKKHAMRGADFSEIRRKDVWSIPLTILREVIINALVHSDYSQRGAPIRVAFYDDRIEVESPGILLPGMSIEDMKNGISKIRNQVIARVFRELGLIEQWGSGVKRIFREAEELGLPEPEIIELGMRVRFIVPILEPIVLQARSQTTSRDQSKAQSNKQSIDQLNPNEIKPPNKLLEELRRKDQLKAQSGAQSKDQSGAQWGDGLDKQQSRILDAIGLSELSSGDIAHEMGLKSKSGSFKESLSELIKQGKIEYTLPETPKSRLQKYRLKTKHP